MTRTIIIDDEIIGINALKLLIERYTPALKVVATATDPEEGIKLIEDYKPDVVFLDISMPGMSAFEMLEKIDYHDFKLVFVTAHQEHAIKAIKVKAHDYLLKPVVIDDLKRCVDSIYKEQHPGNSAKGSLIELAVRDGVIFLKPADIVRLQAEGSYTTYHLENNVKHLVAKNLKESSRLLDPSIFFRCHPSHVINLTKVTKMISSDGLYALMSDGSRPEITRKNKELFLEKLKAI